MTIAKVYPSRGQLNWDTPIEAKLDEIIDAVNAVQYVMDGATTIADLNAFLAGDEPVKRLSGAGSFATVLAIPDGTKLNATGAVITATGTGSADIVTLGVGVILNGLEIVGGKATRTGGRGIFSSGDNVQVVGCYVHEVKAAGIELATMAGYNITGNRVEDCDGQGINLNVADQGIVSGNTVVDCQHGIQWWGGDAAVSSVIGTSDITITGNTVRNVTAGIWGSLGQYVTVAGNTISDCSDVGIDFEGCQDSTATGNTVDNCVEAGLAVFHGSSNVAFVGNTVRQGAGDGAGVRVFGSNSTSERILIEGNTIQAVDDWPVTVDPDQATDVTIRGNEVTATGSGQGGIQVAQSHRGIVDDNRVLVTHHTGIVISGGNDGRVAGNHVRTTADASALNDGAGILLTWASAGYPTKRNLVAGNQVVNFVTGIRDDCWGDNDSRNAILNNIANTITHQGTFGGTYGGYIRGNRTQADPRTIIGDDAQQALLDLKAPLASPALTGNPTVPTQAPGTNNTRAASTAYADAAVAASLVGPTFTGDPKAPTPAISDRDTSIATSAFVGLAAGLFAVVPTSVVAAGGGSSGSVGAGGKVTFATCTSIAVNGAFSALYDNYLILIKSDHSTAALTTMRLRVAGTDSSAAVYDVQALFAGNGTATSGATLAGTSWDLAGVTTTRENTTIELNEPFLTVATMGESQNRSTTNPMVQATNYLGLRALQHRSGTSYDGFTLIASTGTITGNIRIYGYNNL